jgi:hypothetical protein
MTISGEAEFLMIGEYSHELVLFKAEWVKRVNIFNVMIHIWDPIPEQWAFFGENFTFELPLPKREQSIALHLAVDFLIQQDGRWMPTWVYP